MSDPFQEFHYKLSRDSTYMPDYEAEDFSVKDIYVHSMLKVSCKLVSKLKGLRDSFVPLGGCYLENVLDGITRNGQCLSRSDL